MFRLRLTKVLSLKKYFLKSILLLVIFIFFLFILKPVQRNVFNFPLRDEEDNIITGTWVFQDKKMYGDFYFQRQPLPTIISGALQQLTKPNTIYLLIKRHREFILFYSFFWITILILRFGLKGFVVGIILELIKFTLLGNLYLAESLVIYPSIYVLGIVYDLFKTKTMPVLDVSTLAPVAFIILFSRETLAPLIILTFVIVFLKLKSDQRKILLLSLVISLVLFLLIFTPFISYEGFFQKYLSN